MAITSVTLVDGVTEMLLYPRDNLVLLSIDAPGPGVRVVTEPRPGDDGELDTTRHFGARAVAIELLAIDTPAAIQEELGGFLHPESRPYLVVADDEWSQSRRLRLRSDSFGGPLRADQAPTQRTMLAQWRAPDGTWEAVDAVDLTVTADIPSSVGFFAPFSAPISLEATSAAGALSTANAGNVRSHWTARLYGPCTAPRLLNDTTGEELTFTTGLVLAAGEYVEVDSQAHTAYLNSVTTSPRLIYLDFGVSAWWRLQPGLQQIRYAPTDPSAGSQAEITYRPRWL